MLSIIGDALALVILFLFCPFVCGVGAPAPVENRPCFIVYRYQSVYLCKWNFRCTKYLEYHSVCPLVEIGTALPPLPQESVSPPQIGRTRSPAGEEVEESQWRLEKRPSTLSTLCFKGKIIYFCMFRVEKRETVPTMLSVPAMARRENPAVLPSDVVPATE